jgi:hypothetical protein
MMTMMKNMILTLPTISSNDDLIALVIDFIWANLFVLLVQFFCLALILRIISFLFD